METREDTTDFAFMSGPAPWPWPVFTPLLDAGLSGPRSLAIGKAKRLQIFGEHFTLYRGHSGTPFVIADRCAHRSTQLSVGRIEGDDIRCFYHGWK